MEIKATNWTNGFERNEVHCPHMRSAGLLFQEIPDKGRFDV